MKTLRIAIGCLLLTVAATFAQNSINLYTQGSQTQTSATVGSTSTFNLDTYATFNGFTGQGLSYWLEVPNALAPFISLTGRNYFTWTDATTGPGTITFGSASGTDAGFTGENADLGATSTLDPNSGAPNQTQTAGTYKVTNLGFALNNAPNGTYTIQLETLSPHGSEISDTSHTAHAVGVATYTITVVPEPATWSLFGLGGIGSLGLTWLRARRKS